MLDRLQREIDLTARHLSVLRAVDRQGPIGIVALSQQSGIPRHKVRYSLRTLEGADLVEPTTEGAVTTDEAAIYLDTLDESLDTVIENIETLADTSIGSENPDAPTP